MPRHKSRITEPGYHKGRRAPSKGKKLYADVFTRAEIMSLLDQCNCGRTGLRDRALIVTLWRTGLRISEAVNLRRSDVNLEDRTIRVHGTKDEKADRTVGMDQMAWAHLRDWLDVRKEMDPPGPWVFCCISKHEVGNQLQPAQFRQKLKLLARKAGIDKRIHPHGFRHTLAAELARERVDLRIIQQTLGHKYSASTHRYIDHLHPGEAIDYLANRS
jgi:integrase/recombinase XerD